MGGSGLSRFRELTPDTDEWVPEVGDVAVPDRRRCVDRRCSETSSSSSGGGETGLPLTDQSGHPGGTEDTRDRRRGHGQDRRCYR